MLRVDNCPLCGTTRPESVEVRYVVDETREIGDSRFLLYGRHLTVVCPNCNLCFQIERFPDDDLTKYYTDGHYLNKNNKKVDLEARREKSKPFIAFLLQCLENNDIKPTRQLDFGCAQGNLLLSVDWPGVGVEIVPDYLEYARSHKVEIYENLDEVSGLFDFVSLIEVLEHMPYPGKLLKALYEKLEPGGNILITVPDMMGGHPHAISNRHLNAFSGDALRFGLKNAGFEIVVASRTIGGLATLLFIGRKET